jgi:VWFA-related protein
MRRIGQAILPVAVILSLACAPVHGQDPAATPAAGYSESVPYTPRQIRVVNEQAKSKKKDKGDAPVRLPPTPPEPAEQMPGNGPAVNEDMPVTICVSVMDLQGNLVKDVRAGEFKIFVDDSQSEIVSVEQPGGQVNVLLVVDLSPSNSFTLDTAKNVANRIIDQFGPDDQVAVYGFAMQMKAYAPLSTDRARARAAIAKLRIGNGTSLYESVRKLFEREVTNLPGRTVVFLITDGVDTTSRSSRYWDSLVAAERSDAAVYPIYLDSFPTVNSSGPPGVKGLPSQLQGMIPSLGVGPAPGSFESDYTLGRLYLNDLVFVSGGRAVTANALLQGSARVAAGFKEEFRSQYHVTFRPAGTAYVGQRKHVKVRVARPNLAVVARGSYVVGSPPSKVSAP